MFDHIIKHILEKNYCNGKGSKIRIFKIRNRFCCIPKGSLKDNIKDHYMVGFGVRNKSSSEEKKRFTLFVVPLAQETQSQRGFVTPESNILNTKR